MTFSGASDGSIIGLPSSAASQPPGISAPNRPAIRILLTATELVAASKTNGGSFKHGTAIAIGFVPSRGSAPNVGSTEGGQLVIQTPIMSWSNAFMAWYDAIPKWRALPIVTIPKPTFLALSIAISIALGVMMVPRPRSESTVAVLGVSRTTFQLGRGLIDPSW